MPRIKITVPPAPPQPPGNGGTGVLSGPAAMQILQPFPTGDGITWIFGIYGLAESDVVTWDVSLGEFDFVALGQLDRQTVAVVYQGGAGGTVTATVNGSVLGTASYGAPP